jgi:hypothetical protein
VDAATDPTSVAFVRFCTGYAFVAVEVHPCPLASGQKQAANNDNKKRGPRDRLVVLIVFLLFSKSILATDCHHFRKWPDSAPQSSMPCLSMESGRFPKLSSGKSPSAPRKSSGGRAMSSTIGGKQRINLPRE